MIYGTICETGATIHIIQNMRCTVVEVLQCVTSGMITVRSKSGLYCMDTKTIFLLIASIQMKDIDQVTVGGSLKKSNAIISVTIGI